MAEVAAMRKMEVFMSVPWLDLIGKQRSPFSR